MEFYRATGIEENEKWCYLLERTEGTEFSIHSTNQPPFLTITLLSNAI